MDVLTDAPRLRTFCEFMTRIFPVIGHYTATSQFPEVTELYMALMFTAFPFGFLAALCSIYPDKRLFLPIQRSDLKSIPLGKHISSAVAVVLLFPPLIYLMWFINPGLDIWFMHFSTSRESLAFFGVFITLGIPFMLGGVLVLAIRLLLGVRQLISDI